MIDEMMLMFVHRDCLLEAYEITRCPNCGKDIASTSTGTQQVLCTLRNEGGVQENLDILPLIPKSANAAPSWNSAAKVTWLRLSACSRTTPTTNQKTRTKR
jgi:hypothetical protein